MQTYEIVIETSYQKTHKIEAYNLDEALNTTLRKELGRAFNEHGPYAKTKIISTKRVNGGK